MIRTLTTLALCAAGAASSAWAVAAPAATGPAPLIPLKDFFRNPEQTGFQVSPGGDYISFLVPWQGRLNIFVRPAAGGEAVQVTKVDHRDIRSYFWASPTRLVYAMDQGGDENFHIWAVDADGSNLRDLTPYENTRAGIIDALEEVDDFMLVQHNQRDARFMDAYRINIITGEQTLLFQNPGTYSGYVTDHNGVIRMITENDGVNTRIRYRAADGAEFTLVYEGSFRDSVTPLDFAFDNEHVYFSSNLKRDKQAIVLMDPATMTEKQVVFEHPQVDVEQVILSRHRKVLAGVGFEAAKPGYVWFDAQRGDLQRRLEALLPGLSVYVISASKDETKFTVRTLSDRSLGAFYFYDATADKLEKLAERAPWMNPAHMAAMTPIVYQSRDGLLIHGYLTLPVGVEPRNLPVVINPHGGPWARDSWGFNPEVQFLANRGYAVLQMNFRGSTGFGRRFWEMSFKEWGKTMQDDTTDGVQWLIEQGIADPKRISIYGGSYGGYKTLAGVTFTPELYAAGVSYVGPSSLFTLMNSLPPYWEQFRQMFYEMVGNPDSEADLVRAASPLYHIEKIRSPLMIIQGARDPRVKKQESDQIVAALRARGVEVPYLVKDNEGHGFSNEENRFEAYRAMEQFFARHLGGRMEEHPDVIAPLLATPAEGPKTSGQ